jgi:hypothetical protein
MNATARISSIVLVFVALSLVSPTSLRAEPPTRDDLAGSTWELVSYKYADATEWVNAPAGERKIKMITATHFVWFIYDTDTGEVRGSGGGTYTLAGATYTEMIEFGGGGRSELRGKKQVFTLDLKGDRLEQTGVLSTGFKIAEVWQRVR